MAACNDIRQRDQDPLHAQPYIDQHPHHVNASRPHGDAKRVLEGNPPLLLLLPGNEVRWWRSALFNPIFFPESKRGRMLRLQSTVLGPNQTWGRLSFSHAQTQRSQGLFDVRVVVHPGFAAVVLKG